MQGAVSQRIRWSGLMTQPKVSTNPQAWSILGAAVKADIPGHSERPLVWKLHPRNISR